MTLLLVQLAAATSLRVPLQGRWGLWMECLYSATIPVFTEVGFGKGRTLVLSWKEAPLEPKIDSGISERTD